MIVFDSDHLQVIYRPSDPEKDPGFLFITFNAIATTADDRTFFGEPIAKYCGCASLGFVSKRPNWFPASHMALARVAIQKYFGYSERVVYGYSMGAYGALKFAKLLGATTVIAFCPQSSIDPRDTREFDPHYNHYYVPSLNGDMRIAPEDQSGKSYIFFDNRYKVDLIHTRIIAAAINPILMTVPYTRHETLRCFTGRRLFAQLISLCRAGDNDRIQRLAREVRKSNPVRPFGVAMALVERHPRWALTIVLRNPKCFDDSQSIDMALRSGNRSLKDADPINAEMAFSYVLERQPRNVQALCQMATIKFRNNNLADAVLLLQRALDVNRNDSEIREAVSRAFLNANQLDLARAELTILATEAPERIGVLHLLSELEDRSKRYIEAANWARKIVARRPHDIAARIRLVHFLFLAKDLDSARSEGHTALTIEASNSIIMRQLSEIEERAGQLSKAIEWARKCAQSDASNVRAADRVVDLLMAFDDIASARIESEQLLMRHAGHVKTILRLSQIEQREKKMPRAIELARKAVTCEPHNVIAREQLIRLCLIAEDTAMARAEFIKALELGAEMTSLENLKTDLDAREAYTQRWKLRHSQIMSDDSRCNCKVLFLGDSITDQWLHAGRACWEEKFVPLRVANFAISGETTRGLLWRIRDGALQGTSPAVVVLMIGTNDLPSSSPVDIAGRIIDVVQEVVRCLPTTTVVLLGVIPRGGNRRDQFRDDIENINSRLRHFSDEHNLVFVETSSVLLTIDGSLPTELSPDGIHLSSEGYRRWYPPILRAIQNALRVPPMDQIH
jgi:lysophospholipase L1-like esterase/Flp pilus assembly protein TadD